MSVEIKFESIQRIIEISPVCKLAGVEDGILYAFESNENAYHGFNWDVFEVTDETEDKIFECLFEEIYWQRLFEESF